jgi:sensor histidine kinase regulating citrate/malate metabolism
VLCIQDLLALELFQPLPQSRLEWVCERAQAMTLEVGDVQKAVGKGTGPGLEMARRIVENRHQGSLSFQSMPGRTRFTVCLPIRDEA